jgi:hypothetical protein
VSDAGTLRFLGRLRLGLGSSSHEGDERVANGALHRILGRAVERDAVDHGADDNTAPHELAYRVADVLVIPSEAIHPTDDERVAAAEQVEQAATLWALGVLGADAGDAFIPDDLIKLEASLLGLGVRWCSMVCSLVLTRAYRMVTMVVLCRRCRRDPDSAQCGLASIVLGADDPIRVHNGSVGRKDRS